MRRSPVGNRSRRGPIVGFRNNSSADAVATATLSPLDGRRSNAVFRCRSIPIAAVRPHEAVSVRSTADPFPRSSPSVNGSPIRPAAGPAKSDPRSEEVVRCRRSVPLPSRAETVGRGPVDRPGESPRDGRYGRPPSVTTGGSSPSGSSAAVRYRPLRTGIGNPLPTERADGISERYSSISGLLAASIETSGAIRTDFASRRGVGIVALRLARAHRRAPGITQRRSSSRIERVVGR